MGHSPPVDDGSILAGSSDTEARRLWVLIGISTVLVLALGIWAVSWVTIRPSSLEPVAPVAIRSTATGLHSPDGRLTVNYAVQESPGTTMRSSISGVTHIDFHPGYVIVRWGQNQSQGRVFFSDATFELNWLESP